MQTIQVTQYGGPEVLQLSQAADLPAPGPGQVLVNLRAIGVNPVETYLRQGANGYTVKFPWTPGSDGAGTVSGSGQRVYVAGSLTGTYAAQCLCDASQVFPLPDFVSFSQGACLGVPAATAWRALHDIGAAKAGETVLIHGASGGVGLAAVQIAKAAGLRVIGTASTEAGRRLVLEAGADAALDHADSNHLEEAAKIAGGGIPLVLEMLANMNLGADLKWLAKGGRVVVIGSRGEVTVNPRDLMVRDASIRGMSLANLLPQDKARIHAGIGELLASGKLQPVVALELPLSLAPQAHEAVMRPGAKGNVVLIP